MARKATKQVSSIAVGIIRNTGHLIGLANVIGMSPLGLPSDFVGKELLLLRCGYV